MSADYLVETEDPRKYNKNIKKILLIKVYLIIQKTYVMFSIK